MVHEPLTGTDRRPGAWGQMADEILSAETVHEGWFDVIRLKLRLEEGEEIEREIVAHPSGAAVLPYDPARKLAMVITEARPPVIHAGEPRMPEAIAGALEEGAPEDCVRREAFEEGGLRLGQLELVARVWATPSTSTERVHLYLASYNQEDRVVEGGGLAEEDEHVRVKEVPLAALWERVEEGSFRDGKTLILLQALRLRRPELFEP
jgi:nudix-type nucleoside diphosphatase (YffH/AdpP family)